MRCGVGLRVGIAAHGRTSFVLRFNYFSMKDFEEEMREQFLRLKNASKIEDVPNSFLAWQPGHGFVYFTFTGMFRKVQRGEFNRSIAARNRAKLFHYEPEFEFDGKKFPLGIVALKSVPFNLIVS